MPPIRRVNSDAQINYSNNIDKKEEQQTEKNTGKRLLEAAKAKTSRIKNQLAPQLLEKIGKGDKNILRRNLGLIGGGLAVGIAIIIGVANPPLLLLLSLMLLIGGISWGSLAYGMKQVIKKNQAVTARDEKKKALQEEARRKL